MTRAAAPAPELVTDWIPCTTPPVRDGDYEFTYTGPNHIKPHPIRCLFENGKWYMVPPAKGPYKDRPDTRLERIEALPNEYHWRGVRRWVLVRKADPLLTALNQGEPVDAYLADARPRSAKFNGMAGARPFRTEAAAQRFADRYSRLGLTAVLP